MHEESKIQEAEHFLMRLREARDRQTVCFELSAFLSAARSALQYALKEAETKTGGQAWYDRQVGLDPVVGFLRDKRDANIHDQPAPMNTNIGIGLSAVVSTSATLSMVVIGKTGERRTINCAPPPPRIPPLPATDIPPTVTYTYVFADWAGPEDVIALCTRYLAEVRRIVTDGQARGLLTS